MQDMSNIYIYGDDIKENINETKIFFFFFGLCPKNLVSENVSASVLKNVGIKKVSELVSKK